MSKSSPAGVYQAAVLLPNAPKAQRVSDTEWFVSMTPSQLSHASDLGWFDEDIGVSLVDGPRGRGGIRGTQEDLLKVAEFYEQDGDGSSRETSAASRRVPREAAKRIRLAFGLDPEKVAAEVRARFYARFAQIEKNPSGAPMSRVRASFDKHFDEAEAMFPDLGTIELHEDEVAGSDNGAGSERQFGYCADEKPIRIAFAPKTEKLPKEYIDGLMAHEFGHAVDFRYGRKHLQKLWGRLPDSIERRADSIASHVFGRRIEYGQNDIQCIGCGGKKARPRRLG